MGQTAEAPLLGHKGVKTTSCACVPGRRFAEQVAAPWAPFRLSAEAGHPSRRACLLGT